MLGRLPPPLRARFDAYADGVNAWIARVAADPSLRAARSSRCSASARRRGRPSTRRRSASSSRARCPGRRPRARELARAALARRQALRRSCCRCAAGRADDRARRRGPLPVPARPHPRATSGAASRSRGVPSPHSASRRRPAAVATVAGLPARGGSSHWALRGPGNQAFLFTGPQLGFSMPELFVELEVHAPGLDVRGVTAPGIPVIAAGHNGHIAWGITSGLDDDDDLYVERLRARSATASRAGRGGWAAARRRSPVAGEQGGNARVLPHGPRARCRCARGRARASPGATRSGTARSSSSRSATSTRPARSRTPAGPWRGCRGTRTWSPPTTRGTSATGTRAGCRSSRGAGTSGSRTRAPARRSGAACCRPAAPEGDRPAAGLARELEQPALGGLDERGRARPRAQLGALNRGAYLRRVRPRGGRPSFESLKAVDRAAGATAQQRPLLDARLRAAQAAATGGARTVLDTILAWDGDYDRTDSAAPSTPAWRRSSCSSRPRRPGAARGVGLARPARRLAPVRRRRGRGGRANRFDAPASGGGGLRRPS